MEGFRNDKRAITTKNTSVARTPKYRATGNPSTKMLKMRPRANPENKTATAIKESLACSGLIRPIKKSPAIPKNPPP